MLSNALIGSLLDDTPDHEPHSIGMSSRRLTGMAVVFVVSLFAVSFPGASQRVSYLSIPKILFFIGKHFGTGVILSTAFCHLLQDSFEALTSSAVKKEYGNIGNQTGLIILGSLLTIFVIEYVSTSYVDHLHAEPSEPPSPAPSIIEVPSTSNNARAECITNSSRASFDEESPLLHTASSPHPLTLPQRQHYLSSLLSSPRHSRSSENFYIINDLNYHVNNGEYHLIAGRGRCVCVCVCSAGDENERSRSKDSRRSGTFTPAHTEPPADPPRVGRKRQVVGILVLQLGIMIHSLVIGLTLSITHGSEFTTLLTAILFHQLFEGLSLGIRIAALPPPHASSASSSSLPLPAQTPRRFIPQWRQHWLAPMLSILFAITTPAGMGLGMSVFSGDHSEGQIQLTQGLMSAISAGMLIYAATVEMLAGDFVFGNLQGGHEHGHHGPGEEEEPASVEGPTFKKKVVALLSLLAGVAGMGLVGIGE